MTEQNQQSSLLGKIAAYTEIWAKDPHSTIFVSLSEAYRKMGMLIDARDVVERGLLNSPSFSPAHVVLARILCQQGDYQGSEATFQRAIELDSASLAALVGYARLNILLGNESRARDLLLVARDQSPANSVINKLLLSLPAAPEPELEPELEPEPEPEETVEEQEPVPEVSAPLPLASATLAELYLKQGLEKEALHMYRQLSVQKPNDLMLRRQIRILEDHFAAVENETDDQLKEEQGSQQDSVEDSSVPPTSEQPVGDNPAIVGTLVADEDSEPSSDPALVASVDMPGQDRVLETLNQWLVNIQRRRGDV